MQRSLLAAVTTRLRNVRYSYLVLPALIALALAAVGAAIVRVERTGGSTGLTPLFPAGPDTARSVLTTIAASLVTVAGVTFSITIVTLQLVSQQFSPRALRNFLGDRLNQIVAGAFIGVFLYCIVVLRSIEAGDQLFVPGVALTVAIGLAFLTLGLLLVFIHHMAHSIQVSEIAGEISRQTLAAVDQLYPGSYGAEADEDADELVERWRAEAEPALVHPARPGFVQSVDDIPHTLDGEGFRVELLVAPGDFVTLEHPLAAVWTDEATDECAQALRRGIYVAGERDLHQDVGYGVRQLADIAVKALSPSVNDPTTATTCIGYLQGILEQLAQRRWPRRVRRFPEQEVTLVMRRDSFADHVESLVQIGRYATDARVVESLAHACLRVAAAAERHGAAGRAQAARRAGARIVARALEGGELDEQEHEEISRLAARLRARERVASGA